MRKIIVLTGPTASGKTKLAIKLAHKINAQIICADSRIVYKNLDIVSAKPTKEEQEGIVHHLVDILEPIKDFSAGDFASLAKKIIDDTSDNIIITGGSWFYIKALFDDFLLLDCPKNEKLRQELENVESNLVLWDRLAQIDDKRARLIHPNNRDKVIRAIEMCEYLKRPISEEKRQNNVNLCEHWFMPYFEREQLYQKINIRVDEMMNLGLYQEWQKNKELYPNSKILFNTIGYREFFENKNIDVAIDKIKQHTRNFAKRQLTYFRSRKDILIIKNEDEIIYKIDKIK